jgi:hypothetical protein
MSGDGSNYHRRLLQWSPNKVTVENQKDAAGKADNGGAPTGVLHQDHDLDHNPQLPWLLTSNLDSKTDPFLLIWKNLTGTSSPRWKRSSIVAFLPWNCDAICTVDILLEVQDAAFYNHDNEGFRMLHDTWTKYVHFRKNKVKQNKYVWF